ncbi:MAG: hypothetical protein R2940_03845 [Syntrophotaleaceae bacterium]
MNCLENMKKSWRLALTFTSVLAFVTVLHGAVPFLSVPALGQAVWTTGFSQSFINQSLFSIHATNFGAPQPAPIAFGLAGAYPAGLFIAAGMHPVDAYSTTFFLWLALAFWGAWRLGIFMGLRPAFSLLPAALWMSMPVFWAHSRYSMLSLGIGLLPFYFLSFAYVLYGKARTIRARVFIAALFVAACQIAVFMDGYSFMMFLSASFILACWVFWRCPDLRRRMLFYSLPVLLLGFGLAYQMYTAYIGTSQFEPVPLDFFRGYGVDVTFWAIPTRGVHWLWDTLGLSLKRSPADYFGDASVWMTTFSLPLIVVGLAGWLFIRKKNALATGFLIVALAGFYLALGPSLKINSTRPSEVVLAGHLTPLMSSEYALGPTGNGWISETLPGFKNMRAAYRWSALGVFGLWALVVLMLTGLQGRAIVWMGSLLLVLILSNLPNMIKKFQQDMSYRYQFIQLDKNLVADFQNLIKENEMVAFLPYRNDFLVNYLASKAKIRTYNIGGDKNISAARKNWPYTMRSFRENYIDNKFVENILFLLARQEAEIVVIPYINTIIYEKAWPVSLIHMEKIENVIDELKKTGLVEVRKSKFFASVKVKKDFLGLVAARQMEQHLINEGFSDAYFLSVNNFSPDKIFNQVGEVKNGRLYSDGRQGFLHFGPYKTMPAGKYHFVVRGEATQADHAWADVVSGRGSVIHGKYKLLKVGTTERNVLVEETLSLSQSVEDLEVRVYVAPEDRIRIDSFDLKPVFGKTEIKEDVP